MFYEIACTRWIIANKFALQLTSLIFRSLATKVKTSFTFARLVEKFVYSQFSQQSRICFLNYPLTVDRTRSQRDAVILTERERSLSSRHGGLTNSVFSVCCILPQFLTLFCWFVFVFKSFYPILFMTEKYAKGPGTGLVSRMKLCS